MPEWFLIVGLENFQEGAYLVFECGRGDFKRAPVSFLIVGQGEFQERTYIVLIV